MTEYALMIKLVGGTSSPHSFNPYAYFGHSWSYFDIQNLRLAILYVLPKSVYIHVQMFLLVVLFFILINPLDAKPFPLISTKGFLHKFVYRDVNNGIVFYRASFGSNVKLHNFFFFFFLLHLVVM